MPQQFLDRAQVRPVAQQMGGKCVAQGVWMDGRVAHHPSPVELNDVPCPPVTEPSPEPVEEERVAIHDDILLSAALLRFNDALAEMTGNQTVALIWSMLNTIARRHSSAVAIFSGDHPGNVSAIRRALKAQSRLTDLIQAGDADGAESFWRTHVEKTSEIMLRTHRIERVIDVLE